MSSSQIQHFHESYDFWSGRKGCSASNRYKRIVKILKNENIKNYIDLGANTGGVCKVLLEEVPSLEK